MMEEEKFARKVSSSDNDNTINVTKQGDGKLRLDHDALRTVFMRPELQGKPIAIISITGPQRGGKSFLMNFILRYLRKKGIATICVSENPIDKWELLGDLAKKWKIKNLDASQCIMYLKEAEKFKEGLGGHRFNKLYLCHDDRCDPLAKKLAAALKDTADHPSII